MSRLSGHVPNTDIDLAGPDWLAGSRKIGASSSPGRVPASVFDYVEQVASDTGVMSDAAPEINSDP
jgi:hypothetical protein